MEERNKAEKKSMTKAEKTLFRFIGTPLFIIVLALGVSLGWVRFILNSIWEVSTESVKKIDDALSESLEP